MILFVLQLYKHCKNRCLSPPSTTKRGWGVSSWPNWGRGTLTTISTATVPVHRLYPVTHRIKVIVIITHTVVSAI
jgi:hypothetical protein